MENINNTMNNLNINPAPNVDYDRQQYELLVQAQEAVQEHIENIRESMNNALRHPYLYAADYYQTKAEELIEYAVQRQELTRQMNEIRNRMPNYLVWQPNPNDPPMIATPDISPLPSRNVGRGLYSKYKRRRQI